jgi:hypothetical protein
VVAIVQQLDENAQRNDRREIGFVTLRGTNVKNLEKALEQLLRSDRDRR